jgi:iron complex transport system ATP-binding protein
VEGKVKILSFESLQIGFSSGQTNTVLLPPLSADAYSGELIAIIGQNGIGKSTLLRTLAGLQEPIGGDIFINGKDISDYSRLELAQKMGFVSTEPVKITNMTVNDLVSLGRFPYTDWFGKLTSADNDIISDSIQKVGLINFASRFITELSDGERQRAIIARALAQDTDLILMDEPTAFLDVKSKYDVIHLLHDLSRKRGKTIIYSTHDLNIALNESDKIWVILKNEFLEGAPEDLVISGGFDQLFSDSIVKFNKIDGSFSFRNDINGKIKIIGEGIERIWTEKAINRAGYSLSDSDSEYVIEIQSTGKRIRWILTTPDRKEEFNSIYDLVIRISELRN